MSAALKRLKTKLGALLSSYLYAVGMALMFIHSETTLPSSVYVAGYTALGVGILLVLGLCRKSVWLIITAMAAAASAALLSGWRPINDLKIFVQATEQGQINLFIDQIALAVALLLLLISYSLSFDRHGVYVLLILSLMISMICWFIGRNIRLGYAAMPLIAVSAQFSVSGALKQSNIKALLSASAIAALIATLVVPQGGVTYAPLQNASEKVIRTIIEFFNLDRNDVEQRRTFNLISYGWRTQFEAFGGPARPSTEEIMRVESDETLYLRGSIRYTYNNKAWVDETNTEKAGKIKRYMTTGIEGRIYRDEFENAFDLDKVSTIEKYFDLKRITVEILSDNLYWSLYTPGRTKSVQSEDMRIYYNNLGEVFASKQLDAGDSYTVDYYSFKNDASTLAEAVLSSKGNQDRAYQAARLLNRDIPGGIDSRLFDLVRQLIAGKTNEFDIAQSICDYLRTNGTYTLSANYVPSDADFVSYFVLNDMRGYCTHFAAAMTLMARIAGLPARYIEGYLCEPGEDGTCIVTGLNAHAWCEIYFEGFGWVTFEATPSANDQHSDNNAGQNDQHSENLPNGSDENDGAENPHAEPDTTPTPTPTPQPTPSPTSNNWQEPEDDNDEWNDDSDDHGFDETENDEKNEKNDSQPDPPEEDDSEEQSNNNEQNENNDITEQNESNQWDNSTILLLAIIIILALLVLTGILRLRQSEPQKAQANYSADGDKALVWYKACLTALEALELSYHAGYTPISFAQKAVSMDLADESFLRFSFDIAKERYSEKPVNSFDLTTAMESYEGIISRMGLRQRLRWYAARLRSKLGSIEQIP